MSKVTYALTETTPPAAEPVTLDEAKAHMRIDHDADDTVLSRLIILAREVCETYTGRALISRGYSLYLDHWPAEATARLWWDGVRDGADVPAAMRRLSLPRPPLLAVGAVKVHATDDTSSTYSPDNYFVDTEFEPGRIVLKSGAAPPMPTREANGIEIQFTAGYGSTAATIPMALKQGMLQLIAHFYEHRGDDHNLAIKTSGAGILFQSYKMVTL